MINLLLLFSKLIDELYRETIYHVWEILIAANSLLPNQDRLIGAKAMFMSRGI
jgi:hypothetical protein